MFKQLTAAVLAATATFAPHAALAGNIQTLKGGYRYLDADHKVLVEAITRAGVSIQVNVGSSCDGGWDGVYMPQDRILAVCQDDAPAVHWSEVPWTENDLDTLRHEAVHLLQDCNAGDGPGGYTRHWFDEADRAEFVTSALSRRKIERILQMYGDQPDFVIEAELEAFSIAATVGPGKIAEAINKTSSYRFRRQTPTTGVTQRSA